ncbi:MAG TPA: class I SAM-dependent methyltransferase [bacterium]
MDTGRCLICNGKILTSFLDARGVINGKNYPLVNCPSCSVAFTVDNIGEVRSDDSTGPTPSPAHLSKLEERYIRMRWRREIAFLKKFIEPGASILDIGCGSGLFLEEAIRAGFKPEGIDTETGNIPPKDQIRSRVFKIDVETGNLPEKNYGAATFYHSLEHLSDPASALKKVGNILKKNGVIIVQVPNLDSWQFRVFKKRWFHLFLPYHLVHFSTGSLRLLFKQVGFEIVAVRHFSNRWNIEGWSASLMKWNPVWLLEAKKKGQFHMFQEYLYFFITILFFPVALTESIFRKGGIVTVVARRTD